MIRATATALCAAVGLVAAAPATAQQPDRPTPNAALKYWQAFAQLPNRDEHLQQRLKDWRTTALDAAARKLVVDSEKSLLYLQRGTKIRQCDWALDYGDGLILLMPHVDKGFTLARLASLRARIALHDDRPKDALDDALATFVLGRHVGADPILISLLVSYHIENYAIDATALLLPKLDPASLKRVAEHLESLPAAATVEQGFTFEREGGANWIARWLKQRSEEAPKKWLEEVKGMFGGAEGFAEVAKLLDDGSPKRLIQALEDLAPMYEGLRKFATMPREQFLAEWPAFEKKQSASPVARLMLPSVPKCVDARDRCAARLAMLKAAVAVVRDGQGAMAKHADPFGKGPFEHKALPQGFELRSRMTYQGEPVSLTVGSGK